MQLSGPKKTSKLKIDPGPETQDRACFSPKNDESKVTGRGHPATGAVEMNQGRASQIPPHVTEIILESISDGVFTVDHEWHITSFNLAAEKITGIHREEALGKFCWEIFRSNMCEKGCALRRTMKRGKSFIDTSTYIITKEGRQVPVVVTTSLLKDPEGGILGGVETFRDMSLVEELRKELEKRFRVGDMVSRNPSMHKIFRILPQVAESDSTVLIQGETGTGKELLQGRFTS